MDTTRRPDCIVHWSEIEEPDNSHYPGDDELMGIGAPFGAHFGLSRLGINHVRLLPGRRTSYPHAESSEQEFVYVLEGEPEVWLDGRMVRLAPGDGVGFPAGTALCHTFINNTETEVRLLVVGDTKRADNKVLYPLNPDRENYREDLWTDAPRATAQGMTASRTPCASAGPGQPADERPVEAATPEQAVAHKSLAAGPFGRAQS